MLDASCEVLAANIAFTRQIVNMAHGCGVPVEGELGYLAGMQGEDAGKHPAEVVYTSLEEAAPNGQQTGVDSLALSIGNVHRRMQDGPVLHCERLQAVNERLQIRLVIHGGTGPSDDQFRQLIAHGISKINYHAAWADAAGARMRCNVAAAARRGHTGMVDGIQEAIRAEIERCVVLFGSARQADEVLAAAEACKPDSSGKRIRYRAT